MISKYNLKKFIKENPDSFPYIYKEEEDALYDKEDGSYVAPLDKFLEIYRKNNGESFECLYCEHVFDYAVLQCTECGTVIFTYEDYRYEPQLKCPTCTDYETGFDFWTKEDIEGDEGKQEALRIYKELTEKEKETQERIKRRNGKRDWQIAIKKIKLKKWHLYLFLECDDITESYFKGLRLKVDIFAKEDPTELGMYLKKSFTIPLSWSAFYYQFIYKTDKEI